MTFHIILATKNRHKLEEIGHFFSKQFSQIKISGLSDFDFLNSLEIAETGSTFQENAQIKAEIVFNRCQDVGSNFLKDKFAVLADDSGLSVPALDGKPGVHSARYARVGATDKENNEKLVRSLQEKGCFQLSIGQDASVKAFFSTVLVFYSAFSTSTSYSIPIVPVIGEGVCRGKIIEYPRRKENYGFGYDPLFVPDENNPQDKTFGEMTLSEKNSHSHRRRAVEHLLQQLSFFDLMRIEKKN